MTGVSATVWRAVRAEACRTAMSTGQTSFRGNKAFLPSKPCERCQRPMTWRKAWAKNWDSVKYCSEACRRARSN